MRKLFILLVIVLTLLSCLTQLYKRGFVELTENEKDKKRKILTKYLKQNSTPLDIRDNDNFTTFKLLASDCDDIEIFLSGETHTRYLTDDTSFNTHNGDIKLKLLKFFHKKYDIKYILSETGPDIGYLLNRYL